MILKSELVMDRNLPILSLIKTDPDKMIVDKLDPNDLTKMLSITRVRSSASKDLPLTNLSHRQIIKLMSKGETKRFKNSKALLFQKPVSLLAVLTIP